MQPQQMQPAGAHALVPAPPEGDPPPASPSGGAAGPGPGPIPGPAVPAPCPGAPSALLSRLRQCCGTPEAEAAGLSQEPAELVRSSGAAYLGQPDVQPEKAEVDFMLVLDYRLLEAVRGFAEDIAGCDITMLVRRCSTAEQYGPG